MSEVMNVLGDECRGDECRTIAPPNAITVMQPMNTAFVHIFEKPKSGF